MMAEMLSICKTCKNYVIVFFQMRVTFPADYQPQGTTTAWETSTRGIQIEGLIERIGVRVNSDNDVGFTDSFVAYPDDLLGNDIANVYRLPTLSDIAGTYLRITL